MPKLNVDTATPQSLANLVRRAGDRDELRAKHDKTGQLVLYTTRKTPLSGLKDRLFGRVRQRRENARQAILDIVTRANAGKAGIADRLLAPLHASGKGDLRVGQLRSAAYQVGQESVALTRRMEALARTRAALPSGVKVGEDGVLSGTLDLHTLPDDSQSVRLLGFRDVQTPSNKSFDNWLTSSVNKKLDDSNRYGIFEPGNGVQVPISKQAEHDLYRLNFSIDPGNGNEPIKSSSLKEVGDARTRPIAMALWNLAGGNANAFKVLSTVLTQEPLVVFADFTGDSFIHTEKHKPFLTVVNGNNQTAHAMAVHRGKDAEGRDMFETIESPSAMGGALWNVSKDANGNFEVAIDWTAYFSANASVADNPIRTGEDEMFGVRYELKFVIDRAQAEKGRLDIVTVPQPLKGTFFGRVSLDAAA